MKAGGGLGRFALPLGAWLGAPGGTLSTAIRGAVSLALWLWIAETSLLFGEGTAVTATEMRGFLLALFVGAATAALGGLALWALARLSGGGTAGAPAPPCSARASAWLWPPDPAAQTDRVAALLGAAFLLALACVLGFAATRALVIGIARPDFAALAVLGLYLGLALASTLLFPAARNLGAFAARLVARAGPARVVVRSPGALFVALALAALAAFALLAVTYRASLAYLPWRAIGSIAAGCACAAVWALGARRLPARLAAIGRAVAALLLLVATIVAVGADARDVGARRIALDTVLGRAGYAAAEVLFDFDRDGHLGVLGGGDCAPFDPTRNPGAIDVPNDGIDQDCDGADLGGDLLASPRTRWDWPVPAAVPRRPPIVLVTIDTFAASRMGALGDRHGLTPNLDAFAARSTFFTRCFSQGPSTRLSFPSIFTSRFDSEIRQELMGGHPYPIHASEDLLAEIMQRAGYDTVAVLPDAYFGKQRWASVTQGFRTVIDRPYETRPQPRHNSALVTDAAIEALGRRREQPPFLWVHYYDAHSPHVQPEEIPRIGGTREALYEAELKYADREVGRLLAALASKAPDALVIVTADHGIAFDEPRHAQFNYGYDLHTSILHVPLIVNAPFVPRQRLDGLVSTMDVVPTLANLLHVRGRLPFRGASLVPELLEGRSTRPPTLLHEFFLEERLWKDQDPLEVVALRTARFNLIHDRRVGAWELYDWTRDYGERDDLSGRREYAATLDSLKQQLALWTYKVHRGWQEHAARAEAQ